MGKGLAFRHARPLLTTPPHSETAGLHGLQTRSAAVEGCMAECPHIGTHTPCIKPCKSNAQWITVNCRDAMTCYPLPSLLFNCWLSHCSNVHHCGCLIAANYIMAVLLQPIHQCQGCTLPSLRQESEHVPLLQRWSSARRLWRQPVASLAPNGSMWPPAYT
jgi:hypothetical protein